MSKQSEEYVWGKSVKRGPTTFTPCTKDEKPIKILIENCHVLFTPNVYKGDGTETRLNLCLQESGIGASKITQYESFLDGDICSAVKENYIKCKINLNNLSLYDIDNKKIDNNDIDWVNLRCNAIIHIKGKWESKTQIGLQLECSDLQILPHIQKISPFA